MQWLSLYQFDYLSIFAFIFITINIYTFFLYAHDKRKAIKNNRRTKEKILLFWTVFLGGIGSTIAMHLFKHKRQKRKFKIYRNIGFTFAIIILIHIIEGFTLGRSVQFVEIDFYSVNWPEELDGYRIAFMTDMHTISDNDMASIAKELSNRNLDLVLLGGDFADPMRRGNHYQGTIREIGKIQTRDGIFGVDGNHDKHYSLFIHMQYNNITPLDNTGILIRPGFYLSGVQDLFTRKPDIQAAIANASNDDFIILLSHHPDVSMQQSTAQIDLIIAGHTHGGQITFFGFPLILLTDLVTNYQLRFSHGFNTTKDGIPIFTSRGGGPYYNWPRIFARPEIIIFTLWNN